MTTQRIPPRIVFAGSPEFALPTLAMLRDMSLTPCAVLTQPDRPAGRGRKLAASPVKQRALDFGLPVLQPPSLKDETAQALLRELDADLLVVVAYGLILPPGVLGLPRRGCVNVHASLLPRWRGASPVEAAILAGDRETGVSIMQLDAGLDTGPVFATERLAIGKTETAAELEARLAVLGATALRGVLAGILDGSQVARPQSSQGITYAGRISKADAVIDWRKSAAEIERRIRAYDPWPVAETRYGQERLRCWRADVLPAVVAAAPGTVLAAGAAGVDVQTGDGVLRLTMVQMPGRQRISAAEFARGRTLVGQQLG